MNGNFMNCMSDSRKTARDNRSTETASSVKPAEMSNVQENVGIRRPCSHMLGCGVASTRSIIVLVRSMEIGA